MKSSQILPACKGNSNPINWVPSVYFAAGLPFVVLNMVAVLMYKGLGISNARITFWTSLIMLPWTLKPLWSPFLELFRTKKFYVVSTEFISGIAFGLAALSLTSSDFFNASVCCLAIAAISGATHDIAADGIYMSTLDDRQQSRYIGWQGAFYNIAKIIGTGLLVWLAGTLAENGMGVRDSWITVMIVIAAMMTLTAIYNMRAVPSSGKQRQNNNSHDIAEIIRGLTEVIRSFFSKRHIFFYISFIILYRLAEGFVIKIVPIFLKTSEAEGGLGLSDNLIGLFYGTFGAAAFVSGSIAGGYFIARLKLRKALFPLALIFNIPFGVYTLMAWFQPTSAWIICSGIIFEFFGYGFGFVGLTLFMMQQVTPGHHQMSHYAFASGIMNLGVMLPGMASGWLCDSLGGFREFFTFILILTIVPLTVTWTVPFTHADTGDSDTGVDQTLTNGEGTIQNHL